MEGEWGTFEIFSVETRVFLTRGTGSYFFCLFFIWLEKKKKKKNRKEKKRKEKKRKEKKRKEKKRKKTCSLNKNQPICFRSNMRS